MDLSSTKSLYEGLPFPQRNPADEKHMLITPVPDHLGRVNHYCFGGAENFSSGFRALVAGGGTGDAAIYLAQQLSERGSGRVVYLDQSAGSMKIAQERAAIRGLANIDWINGSLLDLNPEEYGEFDYINCVGVIHHLDNPVDGLLALASVLKHSGAMALMVYGRYGRQDITDLRDLFRTYMPVCSETDILGHTKQIMSSLTPRNSYMRGRDRKFVLDSLFSDLPNMADIFLNPVETTFSADELAHLIEDEAGLVLNRFVSYDGDPAIANLQYNPALYFNDTGIRENLAALPRRAQWKVAEIVDGSMHLHCVYVGKQRFNPVNFRSKSSIPYFPTDYEDYFIRLLCEADSRSLVVALSNGIDITVKASEMTSEFLMTINGEKSVAEIIREVNLTPENEAVVQQELALLSDLDWIFLRQPGVPAFTKRGGHKEFPSAKASQPRIHYETPTFSRSI